MKGWRDIMSTINSKKTYVKPNMTNLPGKVGESIINTIMNTPSVDQIEIDKNLSEFEQKYSSKYGKRKQNA